MLITLVPRGIFGSFFFSNLHVFRSILTLIKKKNIRKNIGHACVWIVVRQAVGLQESLLHLSATTYDNVVCASVQKDNTRAL